MNSDFYRLTWWWNNPMGGHSYYEFSDKSQDVVMAHYEEMKVIETNSDFMLAFVSWEMPLDG